MGVDVMAGEPVIAIDEALLAQVATLGDALRARAWHLATAESCTGGLLAGACTAPAGASDWFNAGFVTYSNAAKQASLGVPAALIEAHGAVSAEVAEAMAEGALARSRASLAVAVTGIAGPGGDDHEQGLVHFALARRDGPTIHRVEHFGAIGRGPVRVNSLKTMLEMLDQVLALI